MKTTQALPENAPKPPATQPQIFALREGASPVRTLKIEAAGDFYKRAIKPKIRITGHWLQRAGFKPGSHVQLTCKGPGVIELHSLAEVSHV